MDKKVLMALKKIINLGENLHLYQRRMNDPYNIIDHEYYREEYETYNGHVSEYQCKASRFIKEHSTENIDEINFNDIHRVNSILKAIKDVPKGANELNTSSSRINNKKSNTPQLIFQ